MRFGRATVHAHQAQLPARLRICRMSSRRMMTVLGRSASVDEGPSRVSQLEARRRYHGAHGEWIRWFGNRISNHCESWYFGS